MSHSQSRSTTVPGTTSKKHDPVQNHRFNESDQKEPDFNEPKLKTPEDEGRGFDELGLAPALLDAVRTEGYTIPTPVQAESIPLILEGRDVMGGAQTGTGKTAAFVLPLLQRLERPAGKGCKPRALILAPTRELAEQVYQSIRSYGKNLKLYSSTIIGGVGMGPQIKALRQGMDILVATPGRLLDHLERGNLSLNEINTFILDEADRMLDMGFIRDIRKIAGKIPTERQTLLFSATYTPDVRNLAKELLNNPAAVDVSPRNSAAETVRHIVHPVAKRQKPDLVVRLIKDNNWFRILIFTRTKHGADKLAKKLSQSGLSSAAIHGDKSQSIRTRTLQSFKNGKIQTLVATDIAARGLDIDELPHVMNYDLPNVPEDYIHRIGRTGRAGNEGLASSLVTADDRTNLQQIEILLNKQIDVHRIPGFDLEEQDATPTKKQKGGRSSGNWSPRNKYRGRRR